MTHVPAQAHAHFVEAAAERRDFTAIAQWIAPGAKVLDLGCGTGRIAVPLIFAGGSVPAGGRERQAEGRSAQGECATIDHEIPPSEMPDQALANILIT